MKKTLTIGIMIIAFSIAVYLFESGEKDPNVTANEPPAGVIGR